MHRKIPLAQLIHGHLYPNVTPNDPNVPSSFSVHLSKHLVPEVRIETARFYGSLDTIEARYPGLNYTLPAHRKRLGRFPHHARLFRAFDELGLTDSEILSFCRWEGTLWARERYERDEGVKVRDTTGEEITSWMDPHGRNGVKATKWPPSRKLNNPTCNGIKVKTDIDVEIQRDLEMPDRGAGQVSEAMGSEEDSDTLVSEHQIHQRMLAAASARVGNPDAPLDPEWEQFLKEAAERGQLPGVAAFGSSARTGGADSTAAAAAAAAHGALALAAVTAPTEPEIRALQMAQQQQSVLPPVSSPQAPRGAPSA
ncbi:hypothetical protein BDY21DRAFT_291014 [Lineolata rhizophorae]|uniref:Uncharacterized protein n=1 Tax=Lineolata rhizophorae TaxID=578093 RepID=A0A6A6NT47_9PEZI|nr:hypothetical protein BDY21DRAFT_291014 [Lineolata rhizophorae]